MARKKKNNRNKRGGTRQPQPKSSPEPPAIASQETEIKDARKEALAVANEEKLDIPADGDDPRPNGADLDTLWKLVREARSLFHSARDQYKSRVQELDKRDSKLTEREESLTARNEELDARERELTDKLASLDEREGTVSDQEAALTKREVEIRQREVNAEHDFDAERKAMLSKFDESVAKSRAELEETEREIADKRTAWHEEERTKRAELHKQLDEKRDTFHAQLVEVQQEDEKRLAKREKELDDREDQLAAERRELEGEKLQVSYEKEDLDELRADLDKRVDLRMAAKIEEYEHRIHSLNDQLEQARSDRDNYEETLRQREGTDRKFGRRTPEEVSQELDALRAQTSDLEAELAKRPDTEAIARLEDLEREQEAWQAERIELCQQVSSLKRRLAHSDTDANEREVQRDLVESLKSQRQLLFEANKELRAEMDDLYSRNERKSPFPACTAMDEDPDLQSSEPSINDIPNLKAFVEDMQHRIASDPAGRLYYTLDDLRSFVGGLAMSPLVLLQGISGTGKTSLPVAFARAVGTKASVIEVQAGWRDPQDLVGHYNVFEKRFYEKEFLQALYRASTPRYKDTIHIVLLDEMNLSHPEQYFSDLLSALELHPEARRLVLMTHSVESAPSLFIEGSKLHIPRNVWFVGTANHDETTMDFADKTYDRAHVMQFPERPEPFKVSKSSPRPPVSFEALQKAFDEAIHQHKKSADKAINFLDSEVRNSLANYFQVGWGPRLERQMYRYVPVVVAAGGTVGEATDHMLAMRLLRKLKNRHDNRPEHIEKLKQRIKESWPALDKQTEPTRSTELLDSELRRLGRDLENDE